MLSPLSFLLTALLWLSGAEQLCYVTGYLSNTDASYSFNLESNCAVKFSEVTAQGRVTMELYRQLYSFDIPETVGINTPFWYNFGSSRGYLNGREGVVVRYGPKEPL